MAVYTALTDQDIAALLAEYDVAPFKSAKGIAQGVENTNYMVVTGQPGEAETRYILTVYEARVDENDLPFYLGVMNRLAEKGIPCPTPLQGRDGNMIRRVKGKPAAMVTFLHGTSTRVIRSEHLSELGAMMARMHNAADGFPLQRENALSLSGWRILFDKIGKKADDIKPGLYNEIENELAYLAQHWPSNLPSGVIHADLFPDNVFYDDNRLTGIIDFYFACNDFFVYDLAICLNAWCFEQQREFNVTKARMLLQSYNNERQITAKEKEYLPILTRGAALRFLLTRAHDWIYRVEGALVTPKDPLEYDRKLRFHQRIKDVAEYGL